VKYIAMDNGLKPVASNLSAAEVRKRVRECYRKGQDHLPLIDGLVPPAILNFIRRELLYKDWPSHEAEMLTLYGSQLDASTRAVLLLLEEAKVTFEFVSVDITGEGPENFEDSIPVNAQQSILLKLNPSGLLPFIQDGQGFTLSEVPAMLTYLCQTRGLEAWLPSDERAQAGVDHWLHWSHSTIRNATLQMVGPMLRSGKTNSVLTKSALDTLEGHLQAQGPFLAGAARPSIADLLILPEVDQLGIFKLVDLSAWPHVEGWQRSLRRAMPETYLNSVQVLEEAAKAHGKL